MSRTLPRTWSHVFYGVLTLGLAASLLAPAAHAISDKEEIEMGKRYSEEIQWWLGGTLPDNAPESIRVKRIGRRFAHLSTRKVPFSYRVLEDSTMLNAFSLPGGPIFITKRLVNLTKDDAELAAVLGHETAHLQFRHAALRYDSMQRARQMAKRLGTKLLGKTAAQRNEDVLVLGTYVAYSLWTRPYDRQQEMNADIQGVRWMSKLGYNPQAAITLFQRFAKEREKVIGKQDPATEAAQSYLSNHPSTSDRIARIKLLITQEHLGTPPVPNPAAVKAVAAQTTPVPEAPKPADVTPGTEQARADENTTVPKSEPDHPAPNP